MGDPPQDSGLGHGLRRAVDDAFDATVGRVGQSVADAAVDATGATVEQVIDELEPYLVQDLLPRVLADLRPYLESELVPAVVDGLMPHISESVAPELIDALMPKIEQEVAPQLVDALMPKIEQEVAPQLVDALMPKIEQEVAPQLVDALMPKIEQEVAPQLVDALMPKIRKEIVPTIMDDIIDDPAVRDLIREQSQGLFLDALEGFRGTLADADTVFDRVGRHLLRRPTRPEVPTALELVLDQRSEEDARPLRLEVQDLDEARAMWRAQPAPPAPPGRSFTYGGAVTRLLALAIDVGVIGWVASQGLATLLNLLETIFGSVPSWLAAGFSLLAAGLIPIYLTISYWATGRSLGMAVTGLRLCTPDGRRPGFIRSLVRAWALILGIIIWLVTGAISVLGPRRRLLLDMALHTEVRYSVPETQQRRHIRDAVLELRAAGSGSSTAARPGDGASGASRS